MLCETAREQLNTLSDGERLANRRLELAVWRHCLRCQNCRAYRRQLRRLRQNTRHLPAQMPIWLRVRVLSHLLVRTPELNVPAFSRTITETTRTNKTQKEITMRKRLAFATCATLIIAVTGTLTAQLLSHKSGTLIEDRSGHQWHITSDYRGEVRLYDPQGQFIGSTRNSQRTATPNGMVELEVSGTHLSLHPAGRQEVRDSRGALLGYAELKTTGDKQVQPTALAPKTLLAALQESEADELKYGGVSGVSASPLGANGWDKHLGVSWKVRGQAAVTALDASGKTAGKATGGQITRKLRQELPPEALPPATPRIEITVNGKTHVEQGFGLHDIKNAAGNLLMQLDVQPLP